MIIQASAMKAMCQVKRSTRAFSIPELLVCIGIMAILLSLAVPSLQSARARAREVSCLSRSRQVGGCLLLYAADYRDLLPAFEPSWDEPVFSGMRRLRFPRQGREVFNNLVWTRWAGDREASNAYICPSNTPSKNSVARPREIEVDWAIPAAFYTEPGALSNATGAQSAWFGREARVQSLTNARFSSKKILLFERWVWHSFLGAVGPNVSDISTLECYLTAGRSSCTFVDGHAEGVRPASIAETVTAIPEWKVGPFDTPVDGVWGRDTSD